MSTPEYKWPAIFPENVPPINAVPANGKVYRFVDKIPPNESDFRMYREDNPNSNCFSDEHKIMTYGVSFFTTLDVAKAKRAKERYPGQSQFANKKIASGELHAKLGVTYYNSKTKHLTLWKQEGATPHLYINHEEA